MSTDQTSAPYRHARRGGTQRRHLLLSGTVLAGLVVCAQVRADGPTTQFTVGGQVTAPRTFTREDLQALPSQTQTDSFLSGNSSTTATFTGVPLWYLLNNVVGLRLDPAVRNDVLRSAVIATGSDGYQAVYALGELSPSFGGSATRPELVAYANGAGQPLTTDGFARTTEPGDIRGGRYVSNIASISVLHAPRMSATFAGGLSTQFTVTGQVNAPATFNLASLSALGATTVSAPASGTSAAATFTGVPLWTVLQNVGVTTNPAVRNNILRDFVIATGSDGYQSTISLGEINPDFGANNANPIIVAYAMNGGPAGTSLGANGFSRLVVPDDNQRGRWVSNLVNLELFDVSNWKVLAGEVLDMAGFGYQTLGFTLAGGTLTSSIGPATLTAPTYSLQGGTIDAGVTLGGTGTLTQASGTTLLLGSVATPNVAVSGGTLRLGADERLAATTTLAMTGGTLDLAGHVQTLASLRGTGTVSLSGATAGGTLAVGGGTFDGAIVDGGAAGALVKQGTDTLTLGGASTFAGPTIVNGGALTVNGSLASSVFVGGAGTLGGIGRIGGLSVQSGGTLAPGNSIGTLTVGTTAAFGAGSIYQVEANAAGQSDRVVVGGAAVIGGGTVQVLAASGLYDTRTTYNILTATGGVSGTFAGVTSNLAFLDPYLSYGPTDVNLTLVRNDVPFAAVAATANQASAARGAQSLGFGNRVYDAVAVLSAAQARGAFDALSGEVHGSTITTRFETGFQVQQAVLDRLWGSYGVLGGAPELTTGATRTGVSVAGVPGGRSPGALPVGPTLDPRVVAVWGKGFGSWGSTGSSGNAAALTRDTAGFVAGIDATLDNTVRIGVAGGYTDTGVDIRGRTSSGDVKSGFGAVYAGGNWNGFAARIGGVFAATSTDTRRSVTFPGFSQVLAAKESGTTFQGFGEVGYRFALGTSVIEPFVGGAGIVISRDGFSETGGSAALRVQSRDYDIQTLTTGVRAEMALSVESPFSLRGLLGYRRAFGDVVPSALLTFATGSSPFSVAGVPIDRDAFVAEAGVNWRISPAMTLGVSYAGQIGSRAEDHGVRGNFIYRF